MAAQKEDSGINIAKAAKSKTVKKAANQSVNMGTDNINVSTTKGGGSESLFRSLSDYDKIKHTYESSNGYKDNSYLIKFNREEFFDERKNYSENTPPAFTQIVDAMVRPVFDKEINRKSNNVMFDLFIENCDMTGTTLHSFIKNAILHARMYNITFLLMENNHEINNNDTLQSVLTERKIPYLVEKIPQQLYQWSTDIHGKIADITFFDKEEEVIENGKKKTIIYYKRIDYANTTILHIEKDTKGNEREVIDSVIPHGFVGLPVYTILDFSDTRNMNELPIPKLLNLAMSSWLAYNVNSWITLQGVYQFPIICLPDIGVTQIALSQSNAIQMPNDAKFSPQFIAPPATSIDVLMKYSASLEDKIYKQSEQLGVTGTKTSAMASGVSKEWDFRGSNSLLLETAMAAKKAEEWTAKMFSMFVNTEVKYDVIYPTAFVEAYTNQKLQRLTELLKTPGLSTIIVAQINREIAKILFSESQDVIKSIIEKIDKEEEDLDNMDEEEFDNNFAKEGNNEEDEGKTV